MSHLIEFLWSLGQRLSRFATATVLVVYGAGDGTGAGSRDGSGNRASCDAGERQRDQDYLAFGPWWF